jgi:hypothetical protein
VTDIARTFRPLARPSILECARKADLSWGHITLTSPHAKTRIDPLYPSVRAAAGRSVPVDRRQAH